MIGASRGLALPVPVTMPRRRAKNARPVFWSFVRFERARLPSISNRRNASGREAIFLPPYLTAHYHPRIADTWSARRPCAGPIKRYIRPVRHGYLITVG